MRNRQVSLVIIILLLSACSASESKIATAIAKTEQASPSDTPVPSPTVLPPTFTSEPTDTPEITEDEYIEVMKQVVQNISDMTKVYAQHWREYDNNDKWQELRVNYQNDIIDNCIIANELDVPDKFTDKHDEFLHSCAGIKWGFSKIQLDFTLEREHNLDESRDTYNKGLEDMESYAEWIFQ